MNFLDQFTNKVKHVHFWGKFINYVKICDTFKGAFISHVKDFLLINSGINR